MTSGCGQIHNKLCSDSVETRNVTKLDQYPMNTILTGKTTNLKVDNNYFENIKSQLC